MVLKTKFRLKRQTNYSQTNFLPNTTINMHVGVGGLAPSGGSGKSLTHFDQG